MLWVVLTVLSVTAPPVSAVPFIDDDFKRAAAEAKHRGLPLFVDAWAPWCHSCVSMRAFVFPDPLLHEISTQFVWLSVNTERPENSGFLERFPIEAWPTLFVLDPKTLGVRARWVGSLTAPELVARLKGLLNEPAPRPGEPESVEELARRAQAEEARGRRTDAVLLYRQALARAPQGEQRAAVLEALVNLLQTQHPRECAQLVSREAPTVSPGMRLANIAAMGLSCALALKPPDLSLLKEVEGLVRAVVDKPQHLLADDVSGLFELLVKARAAAGDGVGAKQTALAWGVFLEAAAQSTTSPAARVVFDAHRIGAYEAAGQPDRALPMLEQSERDFPDDYNPPARLASVLLVLGKPEEALAAARRARALVYGPRTLRVLLVQAEALHRLGRRDEARRILREAETLIARLPTGQRQPNHWKMLDDARAKMNR